MEVIKRKILLENGISRKIGTEYGLMTASSFNLNIFLVQEMDLMGIYTDIEYYNEPADFSVLINKLEASGLTFTFMNGQTPTSVILNGFTKYLRLDGSDVSDWYKDGDKISATTENRVDDLRTYDINDPYRINFDVYKGNYYNYKNILINGVSRIISNQQDNIKYTFDANNDPQIGTDNQSNGLLYKTNNIRDLLATVQFNAEGWNMTNSSLSALTKEEYLFGILYEPEVNSDVFIDRGKISPNEMHLRLSEIESLEHLDKYGNGFYNIIRN